MTIVDACNYAGFFLLGFSLGGLLANRLWRRFLVGASDADLFAARAACRGDRTLPRHEPFRE